MEKNYEDDMDEDSSIRLAIQALLEVVDSGAKNMEIMVVKADGKAFLEEAAIDTVVKKIEAEAEEAKEAKKGSSD